MGKKYLDTKKGTLESSVLGVWKTAIEEGDARMDGRTKQYKEHRKKLESARARRVNKEEVELDEAAVNPKDREELDKAPSDTAKKMKRAKDPAPNQMTEAQSGDKEAYKKFFDAALKKFKVSSPAELKGDQKKKFYDYIDKGWEGDNEKAEGAMSQVREFKIQSMKAALAKVWGMEEGHNPFAEHKGTKPHKHPHDEEDEVEEGLEDSPNSANKQHLCAKNVVHEEWGSGQCISTQHADPDEEGNVAWYDVMFEHGIEKGVSINELKVTKAEDHMHASHDPKKKMKKTETGKKPAAIDLKPKIDDK